MTDINIRGLEPRDVSTLKDFLSQVAADHAGRALFHPHPFDAETAAWVCGSAALRQDLYFGAFRGDAMVGYGMLRGWDEGYAVPSFGVYVHQSARRQGVAAALLNWAIEAANTRGAEQVMLKVYESNASARVVYEQAGFTFTERTADGHQLIGRLRLRSGRD